jgi:hypothetical protein
MRRWSGLRAALTWTGLAFWGVAGGVFFFQWAVVVTLALLFVGLAWDWYALRIGHTRPDPRVLHSTEQDRLLDEVHVRFFKEDLSEESVAWLEGEVARVLRHGTWHPPIPKAELRKYKPPPKPEDSLRSARAVNQAMVEASPFMEFPTEVTER